MEQEDKNMCKEIKHITSVEIKKDIPLWEIT